jgi:hypothetical protein
LFTSLYFGLFETFEELLRCKLKVARAARASLTAENTLACKEDFRPSPLGPDFPEPNEALPSQRNNPQGPQIAQIAKIQSAQSQGYKRITTAVVPPEV